jgi:FtsH-binding integral membrane protein
MGTREPSFAAFRRHRYRAHMQGWLLLSLGVATVAYVPTLPNEPLWLAVPVAFLAAVFVVAVGVPASGRGR